MEAGGTITPCPRTGFTQINRRSLLFGRWAAFCKLCEAGNIILAHHPAAVRFFEIHEQLVVQRINLEAR